MRVKLASASQMKVSFEQYLHSSRVYRFVPWVKHDGVRVHSATDSGVCFCADKARGLPGDTAGVLRHLPAAITKDCTGRLIFSL